MLTPIQEETVKLYQEGLTLREVAARVSRSHEWVRKTLRAAGEESRSRGREPVAHPPCAVCREPCAKTDAQYCSRTCLNLRRYKAASERLLPALRVLRRGGTYTEAAEAAGFKSAWHLWGRMHHFGLTEEFKSRQPAPEPPENAPDAGKATAISK